jgi:uncharacterized membrane protein
MKKLKNGVQSTFQNSLFISMRIDKSLSLLLLLSLFFVCMVVSRLLYAQTLHKVFLIWNLFLAWVPYLVLLPLTQKRHPAIKIILFTLWFIFLPNTLYTITDLQHIGYSSNFILYWLDIFLLFGIAVLGTWLGLVGLEHAEKKLTVFYGRRVATTVRTIAIILIGFGIYLGRFPRLNSWYIVTDPLSVWNIVVESIGRIFMSHYYFFFVCLFSLFYWILYTVYRKYKKL